MTLFLRNTHLDLTKEVIETSRCIIVPFSFDVGVDLREFQEEFCKANKDLYVSPFIPIYEEEVDFVRGVSEQIARWETFENFLLEKDTGKLIGAVGLNAPEEHTMNIWLWIRESEHGKWYATESYIALINWAQENTVYKYLKHSTHPDNTASVKLALKFGGVLQSEKTDRWHDTYHIPL